jgi:hypothetical protein
MIRFLGLLLPLLLLTGCTNDNEGIDALATSSCALVVSAYDSWEVSPKGSASSQVAEQNFEEALNFTRKSALEVTKYDSLLEANAKAAEREHDFSGIEKLAGIESFRFQLENLQKLEKPNSLNWHPGSHITIDGWFENLVGKRCAISGTSPRTDQVSTWPLEGYDLYSPDLAYRTIDHEIECVNCGGLTYEFVAKKGCKELAVIADFIDASGSIKDTSNNSFDSVAPFVPVMVEIWTTDKTPDLGITIRSAQCN